MSNAKLVAALTAAAAMIALAPGTAGSASAADAPPTPNAAFQSWLGGSHITASSAAVSATTPTGGKRITQTRGGPLLWTSNTLEWYYTSTKITSSTGSQADGYIFPNTASKGGIKRTYKTSAQHNWRGTMIVGEGSVTPWGNVDLFSTTQIDYFKLFPKGKYSVSE